MSCKIKIRVAFLIVLIAVSNFFTSCKGQKTFGGQYLKLIKEIPLPEVKGRIDHMDINVKDQIVYIAALGNNTLEVVSIQKGKVIHSIQGLDEPQGVAYIPQQHEIFVANGGNGDCYFYDADKFKKVATVHLSSDADDVRYDSIKRKIYVGYGQGGIAVINADDHQQTGNIKLPAHPEGFQIDTKAKEIFVNLPGADMVGVSDMEKRLLIKKWKKSFPKANFPMALDALHDRLFIGYRRPARLVVLNSKTGEMINQYALVSDADDLYYDQTTGRVYASGGGGYINIFQQKDVDTYQKIANIPTRNGVRTSLLVPRLHIFLLAERAVAGKDACLLVYKTVQQ